MQQIKLGTAGRSTTRLGFGCSSIMGVLNRRQSLALLESAFEAGIRHFDTAPMYGYGEAESCLGEFLSRHRNEVTVTTKFGIPAPARRGLIQVARRVATPLVQRFPALKKKLQRGMIATRKEDLRGMPVANPIFTAEQAGASLEKSLKALRTDRIDLWLLHDVKAMDLAADSGNGALLRLMEDAVSEGKVGMFGVGTDREMISELVDQYPEYCAALQYEWSVLNQPTPNDSRMRIHHRALSQHFHVLADTLSSDSQRRRRWSEEIGADLGSSEILARLMLKAACVLNPSSILLFSSKRPEHIRENVSVLENEALEVPARRFYGLIQSERLHPNRI